MPRVHAEGAVPAGAQARHDRPGLRCHEGHFIQGELGRVLRSDDGASHWTSLELPETSRTHRVSSMAVSAGDAKALYIADSGFGVLRSDDQGHTWTARNEGLPGSEVAALATHADRPETIFAYLKQKGIFLSIPSP